MNENDFIVNLLFDILLISIYGSLVVLFIIAIIFKQRTSIKFFALAIITTTWCLFIKNAVAGDILMQKNTYSEEHGISEINDSIRKIEQYIKYREIEILDYKNELEHTKEGIIRDTVEERIKDLSQNVQYMKHVLKEVKEGKSATIEYKQ